MSMVEHGERAECLEAEPTDLACAALPGNRTGPCSCRRHWGHGVGCAPPEDSLWVMHSITTGLVTHLHCKFYYSSQKGFNIFILFLFGLTNPGHCFSSSSSQVPVIHMIKFLMKLSDALMCFTLEVWPLAPAAILCPQMFVSCLLYRLSLSAFSGLSK